MCKVLWWSFLRADWRFRVLREQRQNLGAAVSQALLQAGPPGEISREVVEGIQKGSEALAEVLARLNRLSPQGLAVVISTCQSMLLPAGLAARMATQDSFRNRSGSAPAGAPGTQAPRGSKGAEGKGKKFKEKIPWQKITDKNRAAVGGLDIVVKLDAEQAKLHSSLSQKEKRKMRQLSVFCLL